MLTKSELYQRIEDMRKILMEQIKEFEQESDEHFIEDVKLDRVQDAGIKNPVLVNVEIELGCKVK